MKFARFASYSRPTLLAALIRKKVAGIFLTFSWPFFLALFLWVLQAGVGGGCHRVCQARLLDLNPERRVRALRTLGQRGIPQQSQGLSSGLHIARGVGAKDEALSAYRGVHLLHESDSMNANVVT